MPGSKSSHPAEAGRPAVPDQPLGLTVHTLPQPQEAAAVNAQRTTRGRLKMLVVLLVCAAPVIASYFTYYVVRPEGRRNYGTLIDPQRPLPTVTAQTLDGRPQPLPQLRGQWLLISVAGGACDVRCEKHLYLQRQLREGLGKEKQRVDWLWLIPDQVPVRDSLKPALTEATVLRVDSAGLSAWLAAEPGRQLSDHLYVVDPLGNWMMRFPAEQQAATAPKVKRDFERLLRASGSWDQAGRPAP